MSVRKSIWRLSASCLLALALLCGCQTGQTGGSGEGVSQEEARAQQIKTPQQMLEEQTDDEYHDAFLVDTGGALGTLLVTADRGADGEFGYPVLFQIWDPENGELPIQTFEIGPFYYVFQHFIVVDANFDGYQDFGYMYAMGNQPTFWYYWLWDEETGLFVEEPVLGEISDPYFDQETQVISGWARDSAAGTGVNTFHRWIDGELICVRRIEAFFSGEEIWRQVLLTVTDWDNGTYLEVFQKEYPIESIDWFDERTKWENLNYHGEA